MLIPVSGIGADIRVEYYTDTCKNTDRSCIYKYETMFLVFLLERNV